jgi:DNA-binding response OmpR family regulator
MVAALASFARRSCVLLLQIEKELAEELGEFLRDSGLRVEHCNDGPLDACLEQIQFENPDLLLIGGDAAGLGLCRLLRQVGVTLPVLQLLSSDTVDDRAAGLDAGADDFLAPPYRSPKLVHRIHLQVKRIQAASDGLLRLGDLTMNTRSREVRRAERVIELTAKEFDLLRYMLEHPREVLSREQILLNVWGDDFMGESNIIEVYIRYLRMKIEREDEKKLIHTVRGVGYTLRD